MTRWQAGRPREYLPDLDLFVNLVPFRTNSRGLRDREYPLQKPPDAFHVAVLGSSFTLPRGVRIEDAFHSLLEERLSARYAPTRYEFVNFACGAMSPPDILVKLRQRALAYEPDLAVVGVTAGVVPYYLLERGRRDPQHRWPPPAIQVRLEANRPGPRAYLLTYLSRAVSPPQLPPKPIEPPPTGPRPDDVVKELGELSRRTGIPIVLIRLLYQHKPPTAAEFRFASRVVAEGMHYVDTRAAFRGTKPGDFWIHGLDPHPNARAHAIFADVLEEYLERESLLGR
jgi:hypothetical protein